MYDEQKPDADQLKPDGTLSGTEPAQLDLRRAAERRDGVRPPIKPFSARPFFKGDLFMGQRAKGKMMSDRFSSDRSSFTPQIPRPSVLRAAASSSDGKQLVVGKTVTIGGEISGCERLIVEGHVDAKLKDIKFIEVTQNGVFKGDADVENAVIAGTFEGSLKVSGHLEIAGTGSVKGKVSYKTIAVANGGQVLGTIESSGG